MDYTSFDLRKVSWSVTAFRNDNKGCAQLWHFYPLYWDSYLLTHMVQHPFRAFDSTFSGMIILIALIMAISFYEQYFNFLISSQWLKVITLSLMILFTLARSLSTATTPSSRPDCIIFVYTCNRMMMIVLHLKAKMIMATVLPRGFLNCSRG